MVGKYLYISRDEEMKTERYIDCFNQEWMTKAEESNDGMNNNNDSNNDQKKKLLTIFAFRSSFPYK